MRLSKTVSAKVVFIPLKLGDSNIMLLDSCQNVTLFESIQDIHLCDPLMEETTDGVETDTIMVESFISITYIFESEFSPGNTSLRDLTKSHTTSGISLFDSDGILDIAASRILLTTSGFISGFISTLRASLIIS